MFTIRPAEPVDAAALSRLADRTFRATFAAANAADDMDLHCTHSFSESIQAREIADPETSTVLAVSGDELIGYAQLRWKNAPPAVSGQRAGEVWRLYVDQAWQGRGLAQQLMDACLERLKQRGCDTIWLGVWEHNPRAIRFYQKLGFVEVGEHVFQLGADRQRDILMARRVDPKPNTSLLNR